MSASRNRNELWARVLVDELARAGVREIVVSPGSRSAPVVLAAAEHPSLRTAVDIDERSAGFLALGVGKATGRPAAVVTTSGTAAANLFPAVVEAAQAETPLLLLTSDRPPRLRGADANQAIDQQRLFGAYPRFYHELSPFEVSEAALRHLRSVACRSVAASVGEPGGPVHLNLPFDKPLEPTPVPGDVPSALAGGGTLAAGGRPEGAPFTRIHRRRAAPSREGTASLARALGRVRRPLLVAGPVPRPWETGPALRRLAGRWGIPLLADPLSGARYPAPEGEREGPPPPVVGGYDVLLRDPGLRERLRPDLVVRFGASPTSAALLDWLEALVAVPQVVVDGGERWKDHLASAAEFVPADPALAARALSGGESPTGPAGGEGGAAPDPEWRELWVRSETAVREVVGGPLPGGVTEGEVVGRLAREAGPEDLLFVSSSMPVRELDAFAPHREAPLTVLGNRGASGIDGIVSTAVGASLATGRRVVAVVGDLALLHDAAGLALLGEPEVRVLVAVLNNDGGGIFHHLPIREHEPAFTRLFATPHGRDLSRLAHLYDLPHRRLDVRRGGGAGAAREPDREGLNAILSWALGLEGSGIAEVLTDREENRLLREAALDAALEAAASRSRVEDEPGRRERT